MPPRDPQLPEGTDTIVNGASAEEGGGGESGGFVGSGSGGGSSRGSSTSGGAATDKLVSQVREHAASLRGQATDKLRSVADDGKGRATGLLEEIAGIIDDAARSIDERLGGEYGDYAHRASGAVSSFAGRVREKSVEELVDDTRDLVRKSPTVALAAAAVVGFALMRVVRTGMEDVGASNRTSDRGNGGARRKPNADTTAGGGA
ncbi:hypothetical protein [Sphingosinicella sp. CPCC 101087]|uniref:hypothetical protein n=1 Tax=Sphingosinicella sp. CPCC 101087 TaxID=2497754 RepID=UPI00101C8D38|nr:hypothetical protein [Sphingosinicella sp. CPCC 101087]